MTETKVHLQVKNLKNRLRRGGNAKVLLLVRDLMESWRIKAQAKPVPCATAFGDLLRAVEEGYDALVRRESCDTLDAPPSPKAAEVPTRSRLNRQREIAEKKRRLVEANRKKMNERADAHKNRKDNESVALLAKARAYKGRNLEPFRERFRQVVQAQSEQNVDPREEEQKDQDAQEEQDGQEEKDALEEPSQEHDQPKSNPSPDSSPDQNSIKREDHRPPWFDPQTPSASLVRPNHT